MIRAGYGFGGPCFPRDNRALGLYAKSIGLDPKLMIATDEYNAYHADILCSNLLASGQEEVRLLSLSLSSFFVHISSLLLLLPFVCLFLCGRLLHVAFLVRVRRCRVQTSMPCPYRRGISATCSCSSCLKGRKESDHS